MTILAPEFIGSYTGDLIYPITEFTIENEMKCFIESMEFVYDNIHDMKQTGFTGTKYLENLTNARKPTGEIQITLVDNCPHWFTQQLTQLSKACLGSGMGIVFVDSIATMTRYYCKWENAGDFAEVSSGMASGSIYFKFSQVGNSLSYQDHYGVVATDWQDNYGATGTLYQNGGI